MTDPRDEALARRYRAMAREEPPAALDAAIVAASRRALARPRTSRWAVPVSLAAVLMLAVGVSLEMQRNEPGVETAPAPRAAEQPALKMETALPEPAPSVTAPEPSARARALPEAPAPRSIAAPRGEALRADRMTRALPAAKESAAPAATAEARGNLERTAPGDPLERLERIARLREQGHDREADTELERFRHDFPGYRIPQETWERLRPR
jgi:hypothetical protein